MSELLDATGYPKLDFLEAARKRAPRSTLTGMTLVRDPTNYAQLPSRMRMFDTGFRKPFRFDDIDKAYNTDSFVKQGVDKQVEIVTKHGWYLDCETEEPAQYVLQRLFMMGHVSGKGYQSLVDAAVLDFVKYSNMFLIKKRQLIDHPFLPKAGVAGNQEPIAAYFRADPKKMEPYWSKDGKRQLGWTYNVPNQKPINFPLQDVVHLAHNVQAGDLWGTPFLTPVLEDVIAYRQCEEYMIKLLYRHLNPLFHHEVPDQTGYGGRQEDVDAAFAAHSVIAPDGMIITPPGHKINVVGAESRALRGEGYIENMRERVFGGLGLSKLVMGAGETVTVGSADVMTASMHNRAKFIQHQLSEQINTKIITEILLEGGYDPLDPLDAVYWTWNEVETESKLARENHVIQKWSNNLITLEEARRELGLKPLDEEGLGQLFVNVVGIPEIEANADAKIRASNATGSQKQSTARARPSNQHGTRNGPKIRPR